MRKLLFVSIFIFMSDVKLIMRQWTLNATSPSLQWLSCYSSKARSHRHSNTSKEQQSCQGQKARSSTPCRMPRRQEHNSKFRKSTHNYKQDCNRWDKWEWEDRLYEDLGQLLRRQTVGGLSQARPCCGDIIAILLFNKASPRWYCSHIKLEHDLILSRVISFRRKCRVIVHH